MNRDSANMSPRVSARRRIAPMKPDHDLIDFPALPFWAEEAIAGFSMLLIAAVLALALAL